MEMGAGEKRSRWEYRMGNEIISKAKEERDLEMLMQEESAARKA